MLPNTKRLQIAYLCSENPHSKYSWSGTTYYMAQALQQHCGDVHYFGPIISFEKQFIGRLMHECSHRLLKQNIAYDRTLFVAKKQSRIAELELREQNYDVIFSPIGPPEVAFLHTSIPIVLALDATFALQRDYYPHYSRLLQRSVREGEMVEKLAYDNASMLLFSSAWAANSALTDYDIDEQKIQVVPFGANLDSIPSRDEAIAHSSSADCHLLFIGTNWQRKGGPLAFETLLELEAMGIQATLTICGCTPPASYAHDRMKVIPFLNKHDEWQRKELESLYHWAHFLLVPTRADCTPIAFSEANAWGLPIITTNTGGIADIIHDGENGYALPHKARGKAYAQLIAQLYRDEQRYCELILSSRAAFEQRLNWDVWGRTMQRLLATILSPVPAMKG